LKIQEKVFFVKISLGLFHSSRKKNLKNLCPTATLQFSGNYRKLNFDDEGVREKKKEREREIK
jgi:hypothetical protein